MVPSSSVPASYRIRASLYLNIIRRIALGAVYLGVGHGKVIEKTLADTKKPLRDRLVLGIIPIGGVKCQKCV